MTNTNDPTRCPTCNATADREAVPRMAVHRLLMQFRRCADYLANSDRSPDPVSAAQYWSGYIGQWEQEQKEHLFDLDLGWDWSHRDEMGAPVAVHPDDHDC